MEYPSANFRACLLFGMSSSLPGIYADAVAGLIGLLNIGTAGLLPVE